MYYYKISLESECSDDYWFASSKLYTEEEFNSFCKVALSSAAVDLATNGWIAPDGTRTFLFISWWEIVRHAEKMFMPDFEAILPTAQMVIKEFSEEAKLNSTVLSSKYISATVQDVVCKYNQSLLK
jgi:hypothetical protein